MIKNKTKKLSSFEQKINDWVDDHFSRITSTDRIFFVDHLRTILHAGLSLAEAMDILSKESSKKKLQKIVIKIKRGVESGRELSEALSEFPDLFPPIYVKMIASGEISGQLENSLEQIATQMKKNYELTSTIRGALIYPSIIVIAMIVVAAVMVIFVLPKITLMFNEFEGNIPLPTKILIKITDFVSQPLNLITVISLIIIIISLFIISLKKIIRFKRLINKLNLHWPIFGQIIKNINLAKFSLTLSSLLKSTLPIVQSVEITAETCSNLTYRDFLMNSVEKIKTGVPLSETLSEEPILFPPMITEMLMVGERTGEVDRLLTELADFYSKDVDRTMKNFSTIIEPIIILFIGVAVAGLAISVIMPMYSLVENF